MKRRDPASRLAELKETLRMFRPLPAHGPFDLTPDGKRLVKCAETGRWERLDSGFCGGCDLEIFPRAHDDDDQLTRGRNERNP